MTNLKEYPRRVEAFWRNHDLSPGGRRIDDITKFKFTLRDVFLILAGVLGMYGAQLGAQAGMRSDIRDLKTAFEGYQIRQETANQILQRQVDELRRETKLNEVNIQNNDRMLAELKGMLLGAGVKGIVPQPQVRR